jgi:hypothetical protein
MVAAQTHAKKDFLGLRTHFIVLSPICHGRFMAVP